MSMRYKSKILSAVHEAMQDAHDAGVISKKTMREFDDGCLTEVPAMTAQDIQGLREREGGESGGSGAAPQCGGEAGGRVGAGAEEAERSVAQIARHRQSQGP
jgi:hypothetical protein